jgi:hypothetical protein
LGLVFVAAFALLLAADLVSRDLLDPDLYTNALHEDNIYNRVYTDLLADPEMIAITAGILGDLNVDPSLSTNLLSLASSTLYLVLPPDTIQSATEGAINNFTAYLKGDAEELDPNLTFSGLDSDIMAERILDGMLALSGELIAGALGNQPDQLGTVDMDELAQYAAEFGLGNIGPLPAGVSSVNLEKLSPEQQEALRQAILSDGSPVAASRQVDAALLGGDLHSALALAARPLLQARAQRAAEELVDTIANSEAMDTLETTAKVLGQTRADIIERLNTIRSVMIFLDGVAIPLAFALMVITLGAVVWIHANNLTEMLRTTGIMLVLSSALVAVAWLIIGFLLRDALAARFAAGTTLPGSLEAMIADVVANLTSTIWRDVWQAATIPLVLGVAFLILSFLPFLSETVSRWLQPLGRYRKVAIVGAVLAIILVPLGLRYLLAEVRQPELVCNGHADLCDRPVNEIAYASTHNAMSIADYGWIWPSHDGSVTDQLQAGMRGFLIDTHYWDDQAWIETHLDYLPPDMQGAVQDILNSIELGQEDGNYLCHMMCGLGATELEETLAEMKRFLDSHPNEVIIIVFEDLISPADTALAFQESGLDELVYTYEEGERWPTLRELIRQNRRVLVMAESAGPPPDWYLHAWDYTEETPYAFSELADFDETSCQPNRGDTGKPFFLLNHWITRASPSRVDAAVLNDYDYLLERAQRCADERGQIPNLVGINFYLNGDVFDVVDELNGVRQTSDVN